MLEKYYLKYDYIWIEVPKKYFKKIKKILKIDVIGYLYKNGVGRYYVSIRKKMLDEFRKFQDKNRYCLEYNVDFKNPTKYMLLSYKTNYTSTEVNIDTFNKYARKVKKYHINSVENPSARTFKVIKIAIEND